jgi:hypothetical protein
MCPSFCPTTPKATASDAEFHEILIKIYTAHTDNNLHCLIRNINQESTWKGREFSCTLRSSVDPAGTVV